jgi:hypothetical protein
MNRLLLIQQTLPQLQSSPLTNHTKQQHQHQLSLHNRSIPRNNPTLNTSNQLSHHRTSTHIIFHHFNTNTTMGLLKQGMKYGGIAYAANAISKGIGAHQESKSNTTSGQYLQQPQQPQQPPQYRGQGPHYDQSGYLHQNWCDASCGRQCNAQAN